jgi:hypothetical protein
MRFVVVITHLVSFLSMLIDVSPAPCFMAFCNASIITLNIRFLATRLFICTTNLIAGLPVDLLHRMVSLKLVGNVAQRE